MAGMEAPEVVPGEIGGAQRQQGQGGAGCQYAALRQLSGQALLRFFLCGHFDLCFQLVQRIQGDAENDGADQQQEGPGIDLPLVVEKCLSGEQIQVADFGFQFFIVGLFFEALQQGFHGGALQGAGALDLQIVEQQQKGDEGAQGGGAGGQV